MHWVLQTSFDREPDHREASCREPSCREPGLEAIARALQRSGTPYSEHAIDPANGQLAPDITPAGKVIIFGSFELAEIAARKGWRPGCFAVDHWSIHDCLWHWRPHMLNSDASFATFAAAQPAIDPFFIKPAAHKKYFDGVVMRRSALDDWRRSLLGRERPRRARLTEKTEVLWCSPKEIACEVRLWIVRGRVATASAYGDGAGQLCQAAGDEAVRFGEEMAARWAPAEAYVLDVCLSAGAWKIVEINPMNTAALYDADAGKLVAAIERAFG
ncbi:hypothetical protein DB459_23100 [Bradyrhizobium sp. WD16]|nr:hypothetical protein DB459_23100 [Bradyrhizobium sp. WD16]